MFNSRMALICQMEAFCRDAREVEASDLTNTEKTDKFESLGKQYGLL